MYKITLYDGCIPPVCSGTASYFADDIEQFQKDWFALEEDKGRKERFLLSKSGKVVTDYHSNDESLNIVQRDADAEIIAEEAVRQENVTIELINGYGCKGFIRVADLNVAWRYLKFKDSFHLAGSYRMDGVCMDFRDGSYGDQTCYGNPVLRSGGKSGVEFCEGRSNFEYFKDNFIESICFIEVYEYGEVSGELKMPEIGKQEYEILFRDILGEAG